MTRKSLRRWAAPALAVLVAGGCASRDDARVPVSVPAGARVAVVLDQTLTTRIHRAGDPFVATVGEAVAVDGRVAIAAGSSLQGRVADAASGSRSGTPRLTLAFTRVVDPDGAATPIALHPLRMEGTAAGGERDEIGGGAEPVAVAVSAANEIELPIGQRLVLEIASASAFVAARAPGT